MCRVPFDQPQYKVRLSIQRISDEHTYNTSYTTSNITGLVSTFGIDPYIDTRYVTDILFEIAHDETLTEVFQELGLIIPQSDAIARAFDSVNAQEQSSQPDT